MKPLVARLKRGRPWRAWKRYGDVRGNVLAAGLGYFAFFSIFPAVALAFAVFGFVLRGHPDLLASIADSLNANLPGFVQDAQHPAGLIPIQAPGVGALTITGIIAFAALLLSGLGWLGAAREGIRAVFGVQGAGGSAISNKLRDLGVLLTLGLGIGLSALLTSAVGAASGWMAEQVGLSGQGWVLTLAGLVVSVLADTALMLLLLKALSGLHLPWRQLLGGAVMGGVGFSLLKLSAATLLPRVTANPLFASVAIVVGLLFWLNLIARLTLIAAAWAANDVDEVKSAPSVLAAGVSSARGISTHVHGMSTTLRDSSLPTFGARSADRTTLVAGAVLGASAVVAVRAGRRGIRSVVSVLPRGGLSRR